MLLDILPLTPYLALASSFILTGTVAAVCFQTGEPPRATGFGHSSDRRWIPPYRGAVKGAKRGQVKEAA